MQGCPCIHMNKRKKRGKRKRKKENLTARMKQLAGISRFHDFWRFRISLNATVPGLKRFFFFVVLNGEPIFKKYLRMKKIEKRACNTDKPVEEANKKGLAITKIKMFLIQR